MNKRKLHHVLTRFRWIKPWYFLIIALISAVVCVLALRANNQEMIRLREAVYVADKTGTDVQKPLQNLQAYVTTHMNTNLATQNGVYPPIQLKYSYERIVQARTEAASAANTVLYNEAQQHCEQQNPGGVSGGSRVPCIMQYIQSRNPEITKVPDALYKFSFASPRWSPDMAGWSLVVAVLSTVTFVFVLIAQLWLQRVTRK